MTFLDPLTNTDSRVPNLARGTFMACKSLVEINLSCCPVYALKESCFKQCYSLERVILSKETRKLMECSFRFCISLKYISYENSLNKRMPCISDLQDAIVLLLFLYPANDPNLCKLF